ncbi:hypothetical protein KC337_g83 [Hortaea werneckii]|nr:hypothetical protein KC337_g83 [Hortaea werneckii]
MRKPLPPKTPLEERFKETVMLGKPNDDSSPEEDEEEEEEEEPADWTFCCKKSEAGDTSQVLSFRLSLPERWIQRLREDGTTYRDKQRTPANTICRRAVHLHLVGREILNLAIVLCVLGVTEQDHAGNLVLHFGVQVLDGAVHDGSALTVSRSDDGRVWTLGVSEVEEPLGFIESALGRAAGESVLCQPCGGTFEGAAESGTGREALSIRVSTAEYKGRQTAWDADQWRGGLPCCQNHRFDAQPGPWRELRLRQRRKDR